MDIKFYRKNILYLGIVYFILCTYVTLYEYSLAPAEVKNTLLLFKYLGVVLPVIVLMFLYRNPYSRSLMILLDLSVIYYCIIGELFGELYILALLQVFMAKIFMFKQTKKDFILLVTFGVGALIITSIIKKYFLVDLYSRKVSSDDYWSIVAGFFVLIVVMKNQFHGSIEKIESQKGRLAVIGENLNILLHNIKSQFASQYILVENMHENRDDSHQMDELLNVSRDHLKEVQT